MTRLRHGPRCPYARSSQAPTTTTTTRYPAGTLVVIETCPGCGTAHLTDDTNTQPSPTNQRHHNGRHHAHQHAEHQAVPELP